ncbi:MAG: AbrB/MazE/SpoVT family DNA-binding domain-containing protein [Candidatus Hydrogenedentota bacterium]
MEQVLVSPKYQVVIPKDIRKYYKIKPGEKMVMIPYNGRIEMVLGKDIKTMKGFIKGINTDIDRERDDRI